MFGYASPTEFQTRVTNIRRLYADPEDRDRFLREMRRKKALSGWPLHMRHRNGGSVWVHLSARLVEREGEEAWIEGFWADVTKQVLAQQNLEKLNRNLERLVDERTKTLAAKAAELAEANGRLQELDQVKSQFLSSVSHELRTPLTSIRGFAKILSRDFVRHFWPLAESDPKLTAKGIRVRENLAVIASEGERLTRLINDVLDLNKIESGRMQWHDEELDPARVALQAVRGAQGQFTRPERVRLESRIGQGLPLVYADQDRLHQVLSNLIANAAKFTAEGHVAVGAEASEGWVVFRVEDTGVGIARESLDKVFDKVHQVHKQDTLADKPKGTGLGLAICKQIVEHYGGEIWVESEQGRGSAFSFRLPALSVLAALPAGEDREALAN
jgi:signal transduction histidine kinase